MIVQTGSFNTYCLGKITHRCCCKTFFTEHLRCFLQNEFLFGSFFSCCFHNASKISTNVSSKYQPELYSKTCRFAAEKSKGYRGHTCQIIEVKPFPISV